MKKKIFVALAIAALAAPTLFALSPGTEHFVPGAVRGKGRAGAFWVTDLTAFNPNGEEISVEIYWLPRGENNAGQMPITVMIPAYTSVTVPDVINNVLGQEAAGPGQVVQHVRAEYQVERRVGQGQAGRVGAEQRGPPRFAPGLGQHPGGEVQADDPRLRPGPLQAGGGVARAAAGVEDPPGTRARGQNVQNLASELLRERARTIIAPGNLVVVDGFHRASSRKRSASSSIPRARGKPRSGRASSTKTQRISFTSAAAPAGGWPSGQRAA